MRRDSRTGESSPAHRTLVGGRRDRHPADSADAGGTPLSIKYPPQAPTTIDPPTKIDTPAKIDPAPQAGPSEGRLDAIESTIHRLEALLLEDREAVEASAAQDLRGMR